MAPLSYTLYSDTSELFVEFTPLVVGQPTRFAAHLTKLQNFKPFTEGQVTVSLIKEGKGIRHSAGAPSSPGIFRLALQPKEAGLYQLVFAIRTEGFTDRFVIPEVRVYPDERTALADQPAETGGDEITYLKEQAWKTDFANREVTREPFADIIKTTGQILPAQGDEVVVAAKSNGIVSFGDDQKLTGSPVSKGELLFTIAGGGLTENNVDARFQEARATYEEARTDFERAQELVKDNIISQRDFQDLQVRFERARIAYNTLARNRTSGGQRIASPIKGFIKNMMVSEGQFVTAGQPLASVSQNQRLILQAQVSQRHFSQLPSVASAHFITPYDGKVYRTEALNGELASYGKSTNGTAFVPVNFAIDNKGELIPGSFVEIFLQTNAVEEALVIPVSALMEEQGNFYAYVQTSGEGFEKRQLTLGGSDGARVQVLAGIAEGERVVTEGGYQIKLATASGALPAHGHEH